MTIGGESITDSGAATDTGTGDTGGEDTGTGDGASAADGGEGASTGEGSAKSEAKKYQVKWFGRDEELDADELAARFSDDYEIPFHGLGGKPLLRDGKPLTRKWSDVVRDVQMSHGAADAARRSNETRKQYEDRIAWGKQPENRMAFLQRELGIEDSEGWLLQEASKAFEKRKRLVDLSQKDPVAYEREMRSDFEQRQKAMQESTSRLETQRAQEAQRAQAEERFYGTVQSELAKFKVPMNARTREMVQSIMRDYVDAGADIGYPELAAHVRDQYRAEILGHLDQHSDEELIKLLGDKRRERLRKAEIASLKVAKKAAAPAQKAAANNGRREPSGMTAEEFMRGSRSR